MGVAGEGRDWGREGGHAGQVGREEGQVGREEGQVGREGGGRGGAGVRLIQQNARTTNVFHTNSPPAPPPG